MAVMYGWNGTLFSGLLFTAIVFSCEKFKTGTMIRLSAKPLIGLLAEGKLHKKTIVLGVRTIVFYVVVGLKHPMACLVAIRSPSSLY